MPELRRLLQYVKPHLLRFSGATLMMVGVGFFEAVAAFLIRPIFDRVLNPHAPDSSVVLFTIPYVQKTVYLNLLVPQWIHNVWTVVAVGVIGVTLGKAICEYLANYLINFVGYSIIMDLRNQLYERIIHRPISFFHRHSTGSLMSAIVNDIEKIQLAVSEVLADFLRQIFTLIALLLYRS
jgi:subfamily B ATP-binding cassette protein MsbA